MRKQKMHQGKIYPISGWRSRLQLLYGACVRMRSQAAIKILLIKTEISVGRKIKASRKKSSGKTEISYVRNILCQKELIVLRARAIASLAQDACTETWRKRFWRR